MEEKSASIMKDKTQPEVLQPMGIEKLKFEVSQEMGISPKAKNKKN